jgi:hypothetical protein
LGDHPSPIVRIHKDNTSGTQFVTTNVVRVSGHTQSRRSDKGRQRPDDPPTVTAQLRLQFVNLHLKLPEIVI